MAGLIREEKDKIMSIKLRAWDDGTDTMIYSDKYDDLYDFFYDVKRRENGGNLVSLMLASNQWVHADDPIYEGDIIRFGYNDGVKIGVVECRPDHFCYWQVRIPGDHLGLLWVLNCCPNVTVTGNRYADREWLEDEGLAGLLDDAGQEMNRIDREFRADMAADVKPISLAKPKLATQKPICIGSEYQDGFGHTIKEADILAFKLCCRQFVGEVKRIWSDDRYYWQVWTYESPKLKISLRHMCEDVACTEVRVIGHISTVRQGGVAVQDIGITI
jgi:hypothetical protein